MFDPSQAFNLLIKGTLLLFGTSIDRLTGREFFSTFRCHDNQRQMIGYEVIMGGVGTIKGIPESVVSYMIPVCYLFNPLIFYNGYGAG